VRVVADHALAGLDVVVRPVSVVVRVVASGVPVGCSVVADDSVLADAVVVPAALFGVVDLERVAAPVPAVALAAGAAGQRAVFAVLQPASDVPPAAAVVGPADFALGVAPAWASPEVGPAFPEDVYRPADLVAAHTPRTLKLH